MHKIDIQTNIKLQFLRQISSLVPPNSALIFFRLA